MSHEHKSRPYHSDAEKFGLTDQEQLWDQVSDTRLQEILNDPATTVHEVNVSANTYGEFLFIVVSRVVDGRQIVLTLFGLGYHDYREEWITDHWRWYSSHVSFAKDKQLSRADVLRKIEARRREIAEDSTDHNPSDAAVLFSLLADMGDDDGAYSFLDDLGWDVNLSDSPPHEDPSD